MQVGVSYQDTSGDWFWGQLDCKILANLLKQKVLKYIMMHLSWQLAKTRSLSFLWSINMKLYRWVCHIKTQLRIDFRVTACCFDVISWPTWHSGSSKNFLLKSDFNTLHFISPHFPVIFWLRKEIKSGYSCLSLQNLTLVRHSLHLCALLMPNSWDGPSVQDFEERAWVTIIQHHKDCAEVWASVRMAYRLDWKMEPGE